MKICKEECEKDFVGGKLTLSFEKCKDCEYLETCCYVGKRIIAKVMDEKQQ